MNPKFFETQPFNIFLPPKGQNIIEGILTGKHIFKIYPLIQNTNLNFFMK